MTGGWPTEMCKSLALSCKTVSSSRSIAIVDATRPPVTCKKGKASSAPAWYNTAHGTGASTGGGWLAGPEITPGTKREAQADRNLPLPHYRAPCDVIKNPARFLERFRLRGRNY